MTLEIADIAGPSGTSQNVGGLTGRIRIAAIDKFLSISKKAELSDSTPPTDPAELTTISGNHTFDTGEGWREFYITRDTGKLDFKMNQERDVTGTTLSYEGETPGANPQTEGILTLAANNKIIAEIELADGQWVQAGSKRFPAEVKYEWMSGQNESGRRGWKLTIKSFETTQQYYTGTFTMHP